MNQSTSPLDVLIVGAGPTGLAAALYTAREGYSTVVLESAVIGGLAALTAEIENYPGFDQGIGGLELSDKLAAQAERFGAEVKTGAKVTKIERTDDVLTVTTDRGETHTAKAVIIATGSTYRMLGAPGEAELIGKGVHFCATCDGPVYRGREIAVVGGGNSALQETVFLARFASKLTMLVRGTDFKGSQVLIDEVMALPNVEARFSTEVDTFEPADGRLSRIKLKVAGQSESAYLDVAAAFELIGLLPNTDFLKGIVELDERNFIHTDAHYRTSMPGVFCGGDVRSGSTWQIASAVGEGASAALEVRKYLDALEKQLSSKG